MEQRTSYQYFFYFLLLLTFGIQWVLFFPGFLSDDSIFYFKIFILEGKGPIQGAWEGSVFYSLLVWLSLKITHSFWPLTLIHFLLFFWNLSKVLNIARMVPHAFPVFCIGTLFVTSPVIHWMLLYQERDILFALTVQSLCILCFEQDKKEKGSLLLFCLFVSLASMLRIEGLVFFLVPLFERFIPKKIGFALFGLKKAKPDTVFRPLIPLVVSLFITIFHWTLAPKTQNDIELHYTHETLAKLAPLAWDSFSPDEKEVYAKIFQSNDFKKISMDSNFQHLFYQWNNEQRKKIVSEISKIFWNHPRHFLKLKVILFFESMWKPYLQPFALEADALQILKHEPNFPSEKVQKWLRKIMDSSKFTWAYLPFLTPGAGTILILLSLVIALGKKSIVAPFFIPTLHLLMLFLFSPIPKGKYFFYSVLLVPLCLLYLWSIFLPKKNKDDSMKKIA